MALIDLKEKIYPIQGNTSSAKMSDVAALHNSRKELTKHCLRDHYFAEDVHNAVVEFDNVLEGVYKEYPGILKERNRIFGDIKNE